MPAAPRIGLTGLPDVPIMPERLLSGDKLLRLSSPRSSYELLLHHKYKTVNLSRSTSHSLFKSSETGTERFKIVV